MDDIDAIFAAEIKRRNIEAGLRAARIPQALYHTLSSVDSDGIGPPIRACQRWAKGEIQGLLFTGPVGSGKSTLAAAAMRESITLHKRRGRWVSVPELIARTQTGFGTTTKAEATDTILAGEIPIVLDDLDKTTTTDHIAAQLFTAIETRVNNNTQIIVTTNLKLSELAGRLGAQWGEAIASRLAGCCEMYTIAHKDRRIKQINQTRGNATWA